MNEKLHVPSDPIEQALAELSPEYLAKLDEMFLEGPQTEEEELLYRHLAMEAATSPTPVNLEELKEAFLKERNEILSKGGYDKAEYVTEKSGIVNTVDSWDKHEKEGE